VPHQVLEQSIRAALVYNLIDQASRQVGFARVVSDQARFAWLSDVFVLEAYRGQGPGAWLVQTVLDDPRLAPVGRFLLATADAHGLYRRHGWQDAPAGRYMTLER
jgi:GNAT superfamily N-acetyltransferase